MAKELKIKRGETFTIVVMWETDPVIRKPITAISLASGAPRLTVAGHGAPDGWRGKPYGVEGMRPINDIGFQDMKVIDSNTIEFNAVTPVDDLGRLWPAYTSGGFLMFKTPKDLTDYDPVIDIKDKIGGTAWATSQGGSPTISATKDNATKQIVIRMSAVDTAAIPMSTKRGFAELEMHNSGDPSDVFKLSIIEGEDGPNVVTVSGEVTT